MPEPIVSDLPVEQPDTTPNLGDKIRIKAEEYGQEHIIKINEALERARGKPAAAAVFLGMKLPKLMDKIRDIPSLRERWMKKVTATLPNDAQTLHRKKPSLPDQDAMGKLPAVVPVDDDQIAEAFRQEQLQFRHGLEGALNTEQIELAVQMQRVTRTNFKGCMEAVHGSVVSNCFNLVLEKKDLSERLKRIREKLNNFADTQYGLEAAKREGLLREEKEIAHQIREVDALIVKHKEVVDDGLLTLTMITKRKKAKEKPGFKPANVVNV